MLDKGEGVFVLTREFSIIGCYEHAETRGAVGLEGAGIICVRRREQRSGYSGCGRGSAWPGLASPHRAAHGLVQACGVVGLLDGGRSQMEGEMAIAWLALPAPPLPTPLSLGTVRERPCT